jgi:hypothetical protein
MARDQQALEAKKLPGGGGSIPVATEETRKRTARTPLATNSQPIE